MALTQRKKRPINRSLKTLGDTRLLIIATEGRITEKQYFAQFHNRRVQVKVIPTGEDNKSSPEYVLRRLKDFRQKHDLEVNDELWLMIDVDRWKDKKLSSVTKEAKASGFKLAVSNPCFETWLLCHYILPTSITIVSCQQITEQLSNELKKVHKYGYNKAKLNTDDFKPYVEQAIQNARALDNNYSARWPLKLEHTFIK
ncbi:MAG: RloB domain-containing protein [Thiomargarita sp.]|nr:RloB domain-containing protein [Thiomargarita sp.]